MEYLDEKAEKSHWSLDRAHLLDPVLPPLFQGPRLRRRFAFSAVALLKSSVAVTTSSPKIVAFCTVAVRRKDAAVAVRA